MTTKTFERLNRRPAWLAAPLAMTWLLPVRAYAQAAGTDSADWTSVVLARDFPPSLKTLLALLIGIGLAAIVRFGWYRARVENDIRQFRKPSQTRLAALGLAVAAGAIALGAISQVGLLWVLLLLVLAAALQFGAKSWVSGILTLLVAFVVVALRILHVL